MGYPLNVNEDRLERARLQFEIYEDFYEFTTGDQFSSLAADSGASVAASDAAGGVVVLTTGGTDNNEAAVATTKEVVKFAAGKPFEFEARVQYAEAATNAANVLIGLIDAALSANVLVDDGGGAKASYSGAIFIKVDGGTTWIAQTSVATTRTTTTLNAAGSLDKIAKTAGGSSYQRFRISGRPISSTEYEIDFYIDSVHVARHLQVFTNGTEMQAAVCVKAGTGASQVVNVDYINVVATR